MNTASAAILDHDTLRAAGLRHMIAANCDIEATVALSPADIDPDTAVVFVTPEILLRHSARFFMQRASTIVISPTPAEGFTTLDPTAPADVIIDLITSRLCHTCHQPQDRNALSAREIDVLRLLATGHINKEIADRLSISVNTVLSHRKNITAKLGIKSVSALGVYALMHGYVTERDIASGPDSNQI